MDVSETYRFSIIDDYTHETYARMKIEDSEKDKESICKKYNGTSILMIPHKMKYFKMFRKDGMPIFTENLDVCRFFDNLCESYKIIRIIYEYADRHPDKTNLRKMIGINDNDYSKRKLKSCFIEFRSVFKN